MAEPMLGPCTRVVDDRLEIICNNPGYEEIIVRNPFSRYAAILCLECKDAHDKFFADLRRNNPAPPGSGRPRRRVSQSRGR